MKFAIIRKVPFKLPGKKSRIVWAHVICEHEGLALVLVPKLDAEGSHTIFITEENVADRHFEPVVPHYFSLDTDGLIEAGSKLKMLGKSFDFTDFLRRMCSDDPE